MTNSDNILNLKSKILNLPKKPGVYLFKNKDGVVLYVGKAKNLKARVSQYLSGHDEREQIPYLMEEAVNVDYTVVNSELESLFLENTLIKQYLPKYNILLRDDKNYAFIKIDYSTEIPQIGYARRVEESGLRVDRTKKITPHPSPLAPKFFGPYTAAYKIRNTLHLMRKIFPYCSALKVSGKPCFYYHLHRCPGVCVGKITLDEYRLHFKKIEDFLAGNTGKISKQLKSEMRQAALKKQFEKAARLRDQLNSLKLLEERQTVILAKKVDWDIVSLASSDGYACVNLFKVRGGKLQDKENFVYEMSDPDIRIISGSADNYGSEILQKFLEQYYSEASSIPKIIYAQYPAQEYRLIEKLVRTRSGRATKIIMPQKGKAKNLVKLGVANAQEYLTKWLSDQTGNLDKINRALQGLKDVLNLDKIPQRIECYDISNIQGTNAVGSMVVFNKGLPAKSEYRKFKIRSKSTPDDFAMMKEVLSRRLARSAPNLLGNKTADKSASARAGRDGSARYTDGWPLPDLIVIDGGKGQLSAALEVLTTYNLQLTTPIIGLAKRIEEIFVPGKSKPIVLSHDDPTLQLLQRLRDEAHRFGITFHRNLRSKEAVKSALDDIPGIGPKTKKLLKTKFGTVADIRKVSLDELVKIVGEKLAQTIKQNL
jgi:excinuclease ABC subunit C